MARITPAPVEVYGPLIGEDVPLVMKVHARRPPRVKALVTFFAEWMANELILPPKLVELVRLRIAYYNQCRSCMAMRYEAAVKDGLDEGLVCSLERPEEAADLTAAERSALRYAELMATNHLAIDDSVYDELRTHFTEEEIVELGQVAAFCVGFGRLDATWDLRDDLPEHFRNQGAASSGNIATPWGGTEWVNVGAMG